MILNRISEVFMHGRFLENFLKIMENSLGNLQQDRTSKVGAISKAQKAQSFQNCKNGDPLGFLKLQFAAKF